MKSEAKAGVSPTIRDQDLREAISVYNSIEAGLDIGLGGEQKTRLTFEKVERNGFIGHLIDKLVGKKKIPRLQTYTVHDLTYIQYQLVTLIKSQANVVQDELIKEEQDNKVM